MISFNKYTNLRFIIRKPPTTDEETCMMLDAQKIIWKELGAIIHPFETNRIAPGILDNTGVLLSKTAVRDLNSCMFDINIENKIEDDKKTASNMDLVFTCFSNLDDHVKISNVRMLITYELDSN